MHALKIETISNLDQSTADSISEMLKEFCIEVLDSSDRINEIECRRRDGYIPHSWNKGGWENYGYTSVDMVMGSGYSTGSDTFDSLIEEYYCTELKECWERFCDDKGIDAAKDLDDLSDELKDEYYNDYEDSWFDAEYNSVQVEIQARYLGYEAGIHTISLNVFLCASDAPYHRKSDDDLEIEITFRSLKSKRFQTKLKKAVSKCKEFIGNLELY